MVCKGRKKVDTRKRKQKTESKRMKEKEENIVTDISEGGKTIYTKDPWHLHWGLVKGEKKGRVP